MFLLSLFACDPGGTSSSGSDTTAVLEEKYSGFVESEVSASSTIASLAVGDSVTVNLGQGEYALFAFEKQSGLTYTVQLTGLTADLDLFGHWTDAVGWSEHQFASYGWGTADESFDVESTQDGTYYLAVYGYESGSGQLAVTTSQDSPSTGGNPLDVPYLDQLDIPGIGEAACSSASTAMVLAYHGKIDDSESSMMAAAETVFSATANMDYGLLGRDPLAEHLEEVWGFSSVSFDDGYWDDLYDTIRSEIQNGRPMILGSRSINTAGHYMVVTGYIGDEYESASLILNDPYGQWLSFDSWNTSASGEGVEVDFTTFTNASSDGVFVLVP